MVKLKGADVDAKGFHFVADNGEEMRGRFSDAISESHRAELPKRYFAIIEKTVRIKYSTEEEKPSYFLVSIGPIGAAS
jgi:hypothetical protein